MIRVAVALFVLGVGAIAWVVLLPEAKPHPSVAEAAQAAVVDSVVPTIPDTTPAAPTRDVRVVYPGTDGNSVVRKLADKVESGSSVITTAEPASVVAAAPGGEPSAPETVPPQPATSPAAATTSADARPGPVPGDEPAAAEPGQLVNINTASVESLNQIPGAGRIGRTIASHRPYRSVDELLSKRVIRKAVYDKIKDQVAAN